MRAVLRDPFQLANSVPQGVMEEAGVFLGRLLEELPCSLEPGCPLPATPLSRRVTVEELHGESLELGQRLLADRTAPPGLSALLCQAALSQLLLQDLSPFHCPQEDNQEEAEPLVLLESEGVQRLFLNQLIDVARTWHRKVPELLLPSSSPSPLLHCSVHAIKNTRRKMEDKHLALAHFNQLFGIKEGEHCAYYAVFDGHGGLDAATYAATHLHVCLSKQSTLHSDAASAFKDAFRHTDEMFRGKARRERLRSGTTGVAVLIQGQQLTVAWLGDSQVLLVRQGQAVTLMEPHKPDREDEKQRIEDLGGCVTFMGCWRVNGTYAVSRAIGDFDQKPYVSGEADCSTTQLSGDEDYVLLACDGFFDAVLPSEVPQLVLEALQTPRDPEEEGLPQQGAPDQGGEVLPESLEAVGQRVARTLVSRAKAAGSSDNITVMLVFLCPLEQLQAQPSTSGKAQDH